MKEPDEWNTRVDRWMPTIMATILLSMVLLFLLSGGVSTAPILFNLAVVIFGYSLQLWYELKVGVLS